MPGTDRGYYSSVLSMRFSALWQSTVKWQKDDLLSEIKTSAAIIALIPVHAKFLKFKEIYYWSDKSVAIPLKIFESLFGPRQVYDLSYSTGRLLNSTFHHAAVKHPFWLNLLDFPTLWIEIYADIFTLAQKRNLFEQFYCTPYRLS